MPAPQDAARPFQVRCCPFEAAGTKCAITTDAERFAKHAVAEARCASMGNKRITVPFVDHVILSVFAFTISKKAGALSARGKVFAHMAEKNTGVLNARRGGKWKSKVINHFIKNPTQPT